MPPQAALDRLHLTVAWRTYLPTDGLRDGSYTVMVPGDQVLIQLQSGPVLAIDPHTGATQWSSNFGIPYALSHPLAFNAQSIFAINGTRLYILNRRSGQVQGGFVLPYAPTTSPAADEEQAYLSMGTGVLYAFGLPQALPAPVPEKEERTIEFSGNATARRSGLGVSGRSVAAVGPLSTARQAGQAESFGPQLSLHWDYQALARLERRPLLTTEALFLTGANGEIACLSKFDRREYYRFRADAPLSASMGQHGEIAYVPLRDFNLYAIDIPTGRTLWRFLAGGSIYAKPAVTDEDVFITAEKSGLYRLDRATGSFVWRNLQADRFLAANPKFVYATDRSGRLLILDRARGTQLALYEGAREFVVPISNEATDRLYLASNDGLLLCLYDRDYARPLRIKSMEARKGQAKKPGEMGEGKMPEKAPDETEPKPPEK